MIHLEGNKNKYKFYIFYIECNMFLFFLILKFKPLQQFKSPPNQLVLQIK